MPDLSELYSLMPILLVALMGFEGRHLTQNEQKYFRAFIRLVDKALYEYKAARDAVVAQINESQGSPRKMVQKGKSIIIGGRQLFIIDFVDHMENCLNAVRRLYGLLDAIKSERGGLEIDRLVRRIVEAQSKEFEDIRHVIEHMDDKIRSGVFKGPVMLTISDNDMGVEISGHSIRFIDIANMLQRFYEIAKKWLGDFDKQDKKSPP